MNLLAKLVKTFKLKAQPVKKQQNIIKNKRKYVNRNNMSVTDSVDYQFFYCYFIEKPYKWKKVYQRRKEYAERRAKIFVNFHNRLYNVVMKFGTDKDKEEVMKLLGKSDLC